MRIIETYNTTDRTDPTKPIDKKGITYIDAGNIQQTIFVLPEDLQSKLKELESASRTPP